jgi:hypothetical protein
VAENKNAGKKFRGTDMLINNCRISGFPYLRRYGRKLNGTEHCRTSGIISHCATMKSSALHQMGKQ